jgi:hypothetical protein
MHQQKYTTHKIVVGREGEYTSETVPTHNHLSKDIIALPIINHRRNLHSQRPRSTGSLKVRARKTWRDEMGVVRLGNQRSTSAQTSKEGRARPPKVNNAPKIQVRGKSKAIPAAKDKIARDVARKMQFGPGTRDGASKNRPITIMDDEEAGDCPSQTADYFQDSFVPSIASLSPSIYQPQSRVLAARRSSPPVDKCDARLRSRNIYAK